MGKSPEELKREIEQNRRRLSGDIDSLEDKIGPSRVMQRRAVRARGAAGNIRDRGEAKDGAQAVRETGS
jgi:hypothetical protein